MENSVWQFARNKMKITKLGHCCLLIEEDGKRILTDPGSYSTAQNSVVGIDVILITHEHADHLHVESVKQVLKNNPEAKIITNTAVGKVLEKERISYLLLEHLQNMKIEGILIEGFGDEHSKMYKTIPPVQNTGYFIANILFYPGDAFTNPGKKVGILALPVAGPWMKLSEAIDYALEIKPDKCFPVHDGILKQPGATNTIPAKVLSEKGINFLVLEQEKEYEF